MALYKFVFNFNFNLIYFAHKAMVTQKCTMGTCVMVYSLISQQITVYTECIHLVFTDPTPSCARPIMSLYVTLLFRQLHMHRRCRQDRSAKHCRYNQQEAPSTVWSRCSTGCHHTCTPSVMSGHCNERRAESGDELEKTSWASSKNLDTADRQRNTGQLETDVAECR